MTTSVDTEAIWLDRGVKESFRRLAERGREVLQRPMTPYYLLLGSTAMLLVLGLVMVTSASSVFSYIHNHGNSYAIAEKQLMWTVIGVPCAVVAARMPISFLRKIAWPGYVLSLGLLALTAAIGVTIGGNTNWLALGPVQIQASEVAKLAVLIWAANVLTLKGRRITTLVELAVPVIPGLFLVMILVMMGGDLGTTLIFALIMMALMYIAGMRGRIFAVGFIVLSSLAFFFVGTSGHRRARFLSFTNPFHHFSGVGWQAGHGLYALSTGGILGQGIGASQQKWADLPEAHTDYIFAVLGEELGLVGTLLVLGLFLAIAYAAVRVARQTRDPFVR
ncbi:MAG TPA: FtsW/RodA/SpoVE family cell cycle protein, partial [Nocardioides sp.]|nr:FtsW/RodA/SpoVE family cell cycle protein [Nocardioides sp.]